MATAILRWLGDAGIDTALIDPGKPWQHATDESFNGTFHDEFLSRQWFRNRMAATVGIEQWRQHDNEVRPLEPGLSDASRVQGAAQGWLG